MAFYDDKKFILSHIRHSFITCDDTGMCEMVMLNESMQKHFPEEEDSELLKSIEIKKKFSFDLFFKIYFLNYRFRSGDKIRTFRSGTIL